MVKYYYGLVVKDGGSEWVSSLPFDTHAEAESSQMFAKKNASLDVGPIYWATTPEEAMRLAGRHQ